MSGQEVLFRPGGVPRKLLMAAPLILFQSVLPSRGQVLLHVSQFPGATLAEKVTKAQQSACPTHGTAACVMLFDENLRGLKEGHLPARCPQCVWIDYRDPRNGYEPINPEALPSARFAELFVGEDCGGRINAADRDLGRLAGEIWVTQRCGTSWTTSAVLTTNHTLRFIQGGTFTNAEIRIGGDHVGVECTPGWTTVLQAGSGNKNVIWNLYSPQVTRRYFRARNCQIDGNRSNVPFVFDDNYQNGVVLNFCDSCSLTNLYIHDTEMNGIVLYLSHDATISEPFIVNTGKLGQPPAAYSMDAIQVAFASDRATIVNARISGSTLNHGIQVTSVGAAMSDVHIINPDIEGTSLDGIRIGNDTGGEAIYRPLVLNAKVLNSGGPGIRVYHAGTGKIEAPIISGGQVIGSRSHGVYFSNGVVGGTIKNVTARANKGIGIILDGTAARNLVTGNTTIANVGGQYLNSATGTAAAGNSFEKP